MTTEHTDEQAATQSATMDHRTVAGGVWSVLKTVGVRVRRDPRLALPFAVAGLLLALADVLRRRDPIPVSTPDAFSETISVQYAIYPTGTVRTVREAGALVDLQTPYLLWGVGLELLPLLAIGVAGWMTIARALGTPRRLDALSRYLCVLVVLGLIPGLLGSPSIDVSSLLLGLALLAVVSLVFVRLYLFPAFLVAGRGFVPAVRDSVTASRGQRWTIFGLVLVLGIASWGLGHVQIAGAFLSTAIVAPVQAVSFAVLVRRDFDASGSSQGSIQPNPDAQTE